MGEFCCFFWGVGWEGRDGRDNVKGKGGKKKRGRRKRKKDVYGLWRVRVLILVGELLGCLYCLESFSRPWRVLRIMFLSWDLILQKR